MKLYYTPGACSLAPHIVAHETGTALSLVRVDPRSKQTDDGRDFRQISSKAYVPALELDDGTVLSEGPVVSLYLADHAPAAALAPAAGLQRYRLLEALGYINSELHRTWNALFQPGLSPELRQDKIDYLHKRYALFEQTLSQGPWLLGEHYSIADIYLFVVTGWSDVLKVDLSAFPHLLAFQKRVAQRPAVQAALRAEGLI